MRSKQIVLRVAPVEGLAENLEVPQRRHLANLTLCIGASSPHQHCLRYGIGVGLALLLDAPCHAVSKHRLMNTSKKDIVNLLYSHDTRNSLQVDEHEKFHPGVRQCVAQRLQELRYEFEFLRGVYCTHEDARLRGRDLTSAVKTVDSTPEVVLGFLLGNVVVPEAPPPGRAAIQFAFAFLLSTD